MKHLKLLLAILVSMFTLTGCIQEYKLSEEQSDATAEYMAELILKNDADYKQDLIAQDEILSDEVDIEQDNVEGVTPNITTIPTGTNTDTPDQKPNKEYTLSEVINEKNIEILYTDYNIVASYPEDLNNSYISITPREGNQLIVINFALSNKSKKDKRLNLSKTEIDYKLDVNIGTIYEPSFTLMENDLHYIDVIVPKGETIPVILIYEISKKIDISNINLIVSRENRSDIVEIK